MATLQFDVGHHRTWDLVWIMIDVGHMLAILTNWTFFGGNRENDVIGYIDGQNRVYVGYMPLLGI